MLARVHITGLALGTYRGGGSQIILCDGVWITHSINIILYANTSWVEPRWV